MSAEASNGSLSPAPAPAPAPAPEVPAALGPPPPAAACPPDGTFARLIEGQLSDGEVRRLQAHSDGCAPCSRTLAELARTIAPDHGDWLDQRYRLLDPLGAGAMGVVYTAFDTKLQRKVAVKRLRETGGGASAEHRRARLLREAQLLASLSHPNVLTVHDVGGMDRELYVVMELVDGWPMSQWISTTEPRPRWREIVDLYLEVGRGLSAAHRVDVVHRDVKPENILVARSGRVLIGDFGLAGLADAADGSAAPPAAPPSITETGTVLGTPAYMAPELHEGRPSDALSDQFAFCVSLYESLHGRRPFAGKTAAEIAAAARAGRLPVGRDGVPRAVDRVLAAGLAADPRRRHASMDELAAALARARDRGAPRALRAVAVLAVVAVAVMGTAALLRHDRRPSAPPSPIEDQAAPPAAPETEALSPAPAPAPVAAAPDPTTAGGAAERPRPAARPRRSPRPPEEGEPHQLLYLADGAHQDRDGAACLAALNRISPASWPAALAERALRRRATCEMLRGSCDKGRRLLEPLDGPEGARASLLANCPAGALPAVDDRILAVSEQADEERYAGNRPARRRELKQILLRQSALPEVQGCFRNRAARGCGRRLAILARSYQVLAESFLAGGDCREGALLDVIQSELKFQSTEAEGSDPALGCRAERTSDVYKTCAAAAAEAERRCAARVQASAPETVGAALLELSR